MSRTNTQAVMDILGANYDTINCPKLTPYINAANGIVSRVVTCATSKGYTHTTTELAGMEAWIAAYLYTINDPLYKSKQTGNSSATFIDRSYLDAAKMMDETGCLAAILAGNRASLDWGGKPPSTQIDYSDRL